MKYVNKDVKQQVGVWCSDTERWKYYIMGVVLVCIVMKYERKYMRNEQYFAYDFMVFLLYRVNIMAYRMTYNVLLRK